MNLTNIELEITNATQYATAYVDSQPVATFQRRRVYEKGPEWKCFANDGALLFQVAGNASAVYLARKLARTLESAR